MTQPPNFGMATQTAGLVVWDSFGISLTTPNPGFIFGGSQIGIQTTRPPKPTIHQYSFNLNLLTTKKNETHTHTSYYIITYNFPNSFSQPTVLFCFFFVPKNRSHPTMAPTCMATLFLTPKADFGLQLAHDYAWRRWGETRGWMDRILGVSNVRFKRQWYNPDPNWLVVEPNVVSE